MFQVETISAKMLDYYVGRQDAFLIDIRQKEEYEEGHIKGAVNLPFETFDMKGKFPREKTLIIYCNRGGSSMMVAKELAKRGYRTRSVVGGFDAYRGRNLVISG